VAHGDSHGKKTQKKNRAPGGAIEMAHTYTNLLTYPLFSTKGRQPLIRAEMKPDLYAYMGGIVTNLRCKPRPYIEHFT
jgi:hypothetical protein